MNDGSQILIFVMKQGQPKMQANENGRHHLVVAKILEQNLI
jgi:hypothetical protein